MFSDGDDNQGIVLGVLFGLIALVIGLVIGLGIYKTRMPRLAAPTGAVTPAPAAGVTAPAVPPSGSRSRRRWRVWPSRSARSRSFRAATGRPCPSARCRRCPALQRRPPAAARWSSAVLSKRGRPGAQRGAGPRAGACGAQRADRAWRAARRRFCLRCRPRSAPSAAKRSRAGSKCACSKRQQRTAVGRVGRESQSRMGSRSRPPSGPRRAPKRCRAPSIMKQLHATVGAVTDADPTAQRSSTQRLS